MLRRFPLSAPAPVALYPLHARKIDPVQQHREFTCPQYDRARPGTGAAVARQPEDALLQALVEQDVTVAIPVENLKSIAAPAAKDEEMPAERVLSGHLPGEQGEPIEAATHVRRLQAEPDAQRTGGVERVETGKTEGT